MKKGYWFPWCKTEYTMRHCAEIRERLIAEGERVQIRQRGTHLAGDGTMQPFGKVYVWTTD